MSHKVVKIERCFRIGEASREAGLEQEHFLLFVKRGWIHPAASEEEEWTDEDVLRARLIRELVEDFGVNDEAVPIILHLLDQLHAYRGGMRRTEP